MLTLELTQTSGKEIVMPQCQRHGHILNMIGTAGWLAVRYLENVSSPSSLPDPITSLQDECSPPFCFLKCRLSSVVHRPRRQFLLKI